MESENIVALCDVDWTTPPAFSSGIPEAQQFTDYRKMLDEMKEIDGVVIATPDHHHAFASMAAIKRGKHVYCEKPLTHSVWEARQMAKPPARPRWPPRWATRARLPRKRAGFASLSGRGHRPGQGGAHLDGPSLARAVRRVLAAGLRPAEGNAGGARDA